MNRDATPGRGWGSDGGQTNLDEFAMGSSTENSAYQVTANPWDVSRAGVFRRFSGSCSVRRMRSCYRSGGSIRQPASLWCGGNETNLWASFRFGLVAFASSLIRLDRLDAQ